MMKIKLFAKLFGWVLRRKAKKAMKKLPGK